ncbi:endoribonuclease MazF [Glaesserella parasuis]|uniref:endoribonuclease MazF n=1 Tax=Glaesserella parasuis TaxID=738 RepID=UPI0004DCD60A|nr:endoribonuclease MazF [Glaesserella parasuis]KEZ22962.1 mRNA interferase MazF [Glaesserella parasuis]MCT8552303.1 endoribonuclease MazF [Glaesserella parasuis]MCT8757456.1 endoribonuclease MazF [Glaesserella parasuis]MCT8822988.1 endoribonuclease MazF [Glaesserella parasuis]MDG6230940.1 endoribonuclease MazF [Glaesserella parasuis]
MTTQEYIPDVGDIIWLDFDPQAGHEQAGHRPALVLTPTIYNRQTGLLICCQLTTKVKGYPFEVNIAGTPQNVVLSDQIKSLDWRIRHAKFKGKINHHQLSEVKAKIATLLQISE